MSSTLKTDNPEIPAEVNFVSEGEGAPVVLIHGLAASLHDWDALVPLLVAAGYSTYAPDLLGHGESPKPAIPTYQMDWLIDHFADWLNGLHLEEAPVLIGHSLGGYVALEYACKFPERVRGLVLVDPFYSNGQLPIVMRWAYGHPTLSGFFLTHSPAWLIRWIIDITSVLMGHRTGGLHALTAEVRTQTALDYLRTAPAAYGILNAELNLTPFLASIEVPVLVIWGERDRTLSPASFAELVQLLPAATGKSIRTGHVPHQADPLWFSEQVLAFLGALPRKTAAGEGPARPSLPNEAAKQTASTGS